MADQPFNRTENDILIMDQYFSDFGFFKKLKISDKDWFMKERCYKSMKLKTYKPGDTIFNFGDYGSLFYLIISGKVSVHVPTLVIYRFKSQNEANYAKEELGK